VAQSLLTLGAMFVVMWRLEPALTLLALGVVPFLGLFIYGFAGRCTCGPASGAIAKRT